MNEPDDDKIRQLLKKSPTLTPPESFYRGVMEKIERPRTPWYWGVPAKGLAAACVLLVTVLVTRETHKTQPELFQPQPQVADQMISKKSEPVAAAKAPSPKSLADQPEVQDRVNRSITGLVGKPTVAEELEADEANEQAPVLATKMKERVPQPSQASTSGGVAAQDSVWNDVQKKTSRQAIDNKPGKADSIIDVPAADTVGKVLNSSVKKTMSVVSRLSGQMLPSKSAQGTSAERTDTRSVPKNTEWRGDDSGMDKARQVVVYSQREWYSLWKEHSKTSVPPPPVPLIDFSQYMVVGIFGGTQPSSGFGVGIGVIRQESNRLTVIYYANEPEAGSTNADVITHPFVLRVIPRTSLPVVFLKAQ